LTDASSAVSARDARSGVWGIAEPAAGATSGLVLAFPSSLDVQPGDLVVTAGTTARGNSVYPPNIPIGRVASVSRASSTIVLAAQANVRQLEDVQVLTAPKGSG
jgi:cell shape-determining protein MreC